MTYISGHVINIKSYLKILIVVLPRKDRIYGITIKMIDGTKIYKERKVGIIRVYIWYDTELLQDMCLFLIN